MNIKNTTKLTISQARQTDIISKLHFLLEKVMNAIKRGKKRREPNREVLCSHEPTYLSGQEDWGSKRNRASGFCCCFVLNLREREGEGERAGEKRGKGRGRSGLPSEQGAQRRT